MKDKLLIFKDKNLNLQESINVIVLVMLLSGIFGFIYETIFYRIDFGYFVKRGSTFGPWIPIYVFGGFLITFLTYKFKATPLKVFFLNCLITGTLEYITGYVLYEFFDKRLWDYNTEIWNFGNIDGFICMRSVLFFGLSSLFLIYVLIPFIIKVVKKANRHKINLITSCLGITFLIDTITYSIVNKL